ncbi:hypothetical protein Q5762_07460 [Streptomyces sp. P9(2023)]|uniref:hypothetical protein n=1 Tax=Streptomyces sp. P9(2023) TaxID=3064394 RepID=UPI0028F44938|nr:hypothetical protein [Streptomyces sp. P9(2023)]MDT9688194.1 hypothetical protein [Streptomyces sp. P9(2023)]
MLTVLPGLLFGREVTVEPYLGSSSIGPRYGPAVAVACFLDQQSRTVRDKTGREVTSSSTFYARPGLVCPAESRVTLPDGRKTTVIARLDRDGGGMPTPDHVEVQLL